MKKESIFKIASALLLLMLLLAFMHDVNSSTDEDLKQFRKGEGVSTTPPTTFTDFILKPRKATGVIPLSIGLLLVVLVPLVLQEVTDKDDKWSNMKRPWLTLSSVALVTFWTGFSPSIASRTVQIIVAFIVTRSAIGSSKSE